MKSDILISIIVPCYNQAQYLDDCLNSIHGQSYNFWECIIVNDGSPDNTDQVASRWCLIDARFKYAKKQNGGLSSARNYGLKLAKGNYIQFLDADDLIERNKLNTQVLKANVVDADILISGYRYFYDSEGFKSLRIIGRNNCIPDLNIQNDDKIDLVNVFQLRNPFVISAPIYAKSVFEIVGNFDEELAALEDWDFNLRCAQQGMKFHHTGYGNSDKTLIRIHDSSMMSSSKMMDQAFCSFRIKHDLDNPSTLFTKNTTKILSIGRLITPPIAIIILKELRVKFTQLKIF